VRWKRVRSTDVIDQRAGGGFPGGGRVAIPGGLGVTGIIIYLAISLLSGGGGASTTPSALPAGQDPEKDLKDFSVYVFESTQRRWERTFRQQGKPYEHAKLVLYRGGVQTGCGGASSSVGPFYCPADQRVYLDLSFYRDMTDQLDAPGDFAWAYVIAHEMGHHVQEQLGTTSWSKDSVRIELQADCYAGVWAKSVFKQLESGDIDEAMNASRAVGDDRLQRKATGSVNPDTFTHGTSAQRSHWFSVGQQSGDPSACDTFSGSI
jgi:predicted metalloprotease